MKEIKEHLRGGYPMFMDEKVLKYYWNDNPLQINLQFQHDFFIHMEMQGPHDG